MSNDRGARAVDGGLEEGAQGTAAGGDYDAHGRERRGLGTRGAGDDYLRPSSGDFLNCSALRKSTKKNRENSYARDDATA